MDDIYTGDLTHDPSFMTYLRNSGSRSGATQSATTLDQIIQNALAKSSDNMFRNKQLQLQQAGLNESARQFNVGMENREDIRDMQSATGLLGTAAQLGTMYMLGDPYLPYRRPIE